MPNKIVQILAERLSKYGFTDTLGHPLENCANFQKLVVLANSGEEYLMREKEETEASLADGNPDFQPYREAELEYLATVNVKLEIHVETTRGSEPELFERDEDHCETTIEWRVNGECPTGWGEGQQGRTNADFQLRYQQVKGLMCWIERRTVTTVTEWRSASPLKGRTAPVPVS